MVRKKAKDDNDLTVEKSTEVVLTPETDDGEMYLTEVELRTLDLHIAREQMNRAIRDKLALEEEMLKIRYDNERSILRKKQADSEASRVEATRNYNSARDAIMRRLGVNLDEYVVSDHGKLRKISETGPS